jgi:hypothetical protein
LWHCSESGFRIQILTPGKVETRNRNLQNAEYGLRYHGIRIPDPGTEDSGSGSLVLHWNGPDPNFVVRTGIRIQRTKFRIRILRVSFKVKDGLVRGTGALRIYRLKPCNTFTKNGGADDRCNKNVVHSQKYR